jgi:hypothetical protein
MSRIEWEDGMSRVEWENGVQTTYSDDGTIAEIKRIPRPPAQVTPRPTITCPVCGGPGKVVGVPCRYCKH